MRTITVSLNRAADDLNNKHLTLRVERAGTSYWWKVTVREDGYPEAKIGDGIDGFDRMKAQVAEMATFEGFSPAHRAALTKVMNAA